MAQNSKAPMKPDIFVSHISQTQLSKLDFQMKMSALAIESYLSIICTEKFLNDDTENKERHENYNIYYVVFHTWIGLVPPMDCYEYSFRC